MVDAKTDDDYKVPDSGYGGLTNRFSCDKPIIAAVNGLALGGGFELALSCDLVIAADDAFFTLAYCKIGTSPDGSSSFHLPRAVGIKKAMEIARQQRR